MAELLAIGPRARNPEGGGENCRAQFSLREFYRRVLAAAVPRLLGLMNRNPVSATWGCLDRSFWHYKTLADFPCATYQQPALAFAWLYAGARQREEFGWGTALFEAARAAMLFWVKIQHRDGSFDEFYQNEHSFCPTAFTSFAVAEALLALRGNLGDGEQEQVLAALCRAGDWLIEHDNPAVANQVMAAANALASISLLTAEDRYRAGAEAKLGAVLASQHREGWFPEYGGADIGYSFKALDLLGHYFIRSGGDQVACALERLLDFVAPFAHPDGTTGGFYGSRNAAHFLPYGLELLSARGFRKARYLLQVFWEGVTRETVLAPLAIDDKYLAYFYINSYAGALLASGDRPAEPVELPERVVLRGAGLFRIHRGDLYLVGSGFKGGCFKLYWRDRLWYQEAGYFGAFEDGTEFSSQTWDPEAPWEVREQEGRSVIEVKSGFVRFDDSLPLARHAVAFKLFTRLALRAGWLARLFHRLVKAKKVTAITPVPLRLERQIIVEAGRVVVRDTLYREGSRRLASLRVCADATVGHSASTRYVAPGDLTANTAGWDTATAVQRLNESGTAFSERELPAAIER